MIGFSLRQCLQAGIGLEGLPPHIIKLARFLSQAPQKKVEAIMALLDETPCYSYDQHKDKNKPTGKIKLTLEEAAQTPRQTDRREGVKYIDFERRSGKNRRSGALSIKTYTGKLSPLETQAQKKKKEGDSDRTRPQRDGQLIGVAFVGVLRERRFTAGWVGEAGRDPVFTLGALNHLHRDLLNRSET